MNLHHFVRAEARRRARGLATLLPLNDHVLTAYERYAQVSLIFDEELVKLKDDLAAGGSPSHALKSAADVYRRQIWPSQDRENRSWIERVEPLVQKESVPVMKQLENAYQAQWPEGMVLVDVCPDTGPTLAYTTGKPHDTVGHVVIDPRRCSELAVAFEMVFHEVSHVTDEQIMTDVRRAAARVSRTAPEDLWHAIIFHTAGFVALQAKVAPDFVPYARRFDVFPQFRAALDEHWQPWLEGKRTHTQALDGLLLALG